MAWIRMVPKAEATGKLADLFRRIAPGDGEAVDHILAIHSLNPTSLERHLDLYKNLLYGQGPLSRRERELVAVAVSSANRCPY
jgi:alkylhydroperoxidase family enzyme